MLPDECALATAGGRQVVVDEFGDVARSNGYCGIYSADHRLLDGVDVELRTGDDVKWDVLGRELDGDAITTTLASDARGPGRGDARAWTLTKQFRIASDGVRLTVSVQNNTPTPSTADVSITVVPDFSHVFEVPSFFSPREIPAPTVDRTVDRGSLRFTADGRDDARRAVTIAPNDETSASLTENGGLITSSVELASAGRAEAVIDVSLSDGERTAPDVSPDLPTTGDERLLAAARRTLDALMLPSGVPGAGAPRFLAPFGRDSLVVSYQLLPFDANVAERTLRYLAAEQGQTRDDATLEAPGRILHEHRRGDLVDAGESIRRPYYGTVDATPLFASLYADTVDATGDESLAGDLFDAARAAIEWTLGSLDECGFLAYEPHDHPYGLAHLGWKDSAEALARPDGTPATGTVRLAEVQGYVHRALTRFAPLARRYGDEALADECVTVARRLSASFEDRFWLPDEGCYALGVDEAGVIDSVASNQAHALWGGLGSRDRVASAVDRLTDEDVLASAGLRTFAASHDAFDPLSYHRGSVWPHDNSIAAMGFAERGFDDAAETVAERGLAALRHSYERGRHDRFGFPELVPGTDGVDDGPTTLRHPDACEPAAWSAGSVFGFLQAHPDRSPP
ncbi:amylo-alpha-1,6-glucosidase [Halomicrococcus sp. NG-SE-24]|uniref:amylo-alpha-1,6-glucosidase n=1 Tax=Halomicrococcus sp. NG-SE-24 TaxID=3436928 RepID=UPI003D999AE1